jgi:predicted DNA-binding transcriptional regulator AlpA
MAEQLVGQAQIAERLGVARNTVWRWTRREGFPPPEVRVSGVPMWRWGAVEDWAKANLPLPGGRPKRAAD